MLDLVTGRGGTCWNTRITRRGSLRSAATSSGRHLQITWSDLLREGGGGGGGGDSKFWLWSWLIEDCSNLTFAHPMCIVKMITYVFNKLHLMPGRGSSRDLADGDDGGVL